MRKWLNILRVTLFPKLCARCQKVAESLLGDLAALRLDYRRLDLQIRRQRAVASRDCDELLRMQPERQVKRIRGSYTRFRSRPLAEELLRRSKDQVRTRPEEALRLIEVAELVADRLVGVHNLAGGHLGVLDLQAEVKASRGNVLRILHRLEEAADCFEASLAELMIGSGDGLVAAKIFSLYASLLRDTRQYPRALDYLEQAEQLYREAQEEQLLGRIQVKRAVVLDEMLATDVAVGVVEQAIAILDPAKNRELAAIARLNLAFYQSVLGRFQDARKALEESDHLSQWAYFEPGESIERYRLWTRAKIAAGTGEPVEAEPMLRRAQERFEACGDSYRSALVRLDLAMLYATEHRFEELAAIAEQTYTGLACHALH